MVYIRVHADEPPDILPWLRDLRPEVLEQVIEIVSRVLPVADLLLVLRPASPAVQRQELSQLFTQSGNRFSSGSGYQSFQSLMSMNDIRPFRRWLSPWCRMIVQSP